jgi:hypothetical protein
MSDSPDHHLLEALLDSWERSNTILFNLLRALPEDWLEARAMEGSGDHEQPSPAQLNTHRWSERSRNPFPHGGPRWQPRGIDATTTRTAAPQIRSGLPHPAMAQGCAVGLGMVTTYLLCAAAAGVQWPLPADLDDVPLEARLFTRPACPQASGRVIPDWSQLDHELKNRTSRLCCCGRSIAQRARAASATASFVTRIAAERAPQALDEPGYRAGRVILLTCEREASSSRSGGDR